LRLDNCCPSFAELITSTRRTHNPKFVPIGRKGAFGKIREIYGTDKYKKGDIAQQYIDT